MQMALKHLTNVVRRTRGCVVSNAIEARNVPHMGVGIVAREHIPKETLVFQAGQDAWYPFSADHALETAQQKAPGFLKQWDQLVASNMALKETDSFVSSALVLAVHLLVNFPHSEDKNAASATIAAMNTTRLDELYINTLPHFVDLPLFWNERQYNELQGCEEARRAIKHGTRFYSRVYQYFFGSSNHFVKPEAFMWAISILMSRATSGKNQPFTLIPFFDWFNHADNGDECIQDFDSQKGFTVHTTKSYEPGEQLFINYGNHGNLRLLRNYGFTIRANPYDIVSLPMPRLLQQLNPADSAFSLKQELLSFNGSRADVLARKSLSIQHDGNLTPNAKHWLGIMLASPEELNEMARQIAAQLPPGEDMIPSSWLPLSLARKVSAEVRSLVTSRMKQHSSLFEEDDAFLHANEQQMAPWLRSCLHLRMGEKQTLMRAFDKHSLTNNLDAQIK